jgi:hypothetical protein
MGFIEELYESKFVRDTNNMPLLTYQDCCNHLVLQVIVLEFLNQYTDHKRFVIEYTKQTMNYRNLNKFSSSSTDLHNYVFFVTTNDDNNLQKLKNPEQAIEQRKKTSMPEQGFMRFLVKMSYQQKDPTRPSFLLNLEKSLNISDARLKEARRYLSYFEKLSDNDRGRLARLLLQLSKLMQYKSLLTKEVIDLNKKVR